MTRAVRGAPTIGPGAPRWLFARAVRATAGRAVVRLFSTRIVGWERVPSGGCVLAGNHVSYLDPVLLWSALPRPVHFVAKAELWEVPLLGWALDHFWAIPVHRGSADKRMIETASSLLERGEIVGMFPEGTRQADPGADPMMSAHGGAAFLALRCGVPVVPIGIAGTERAWPKGARLPRVVPVAAWIGEPVRPEAFTGTRKERVGAMTAAIMERIRAARSKASEVIA